MHNDLVSLDVDKQHGIWFLQFIFVRKPPILFVTLVTCSRNLRFNNLNKWLFLFSLDEQ
jgi:hypothetical protein